MVMKKTLSEVQWKVFQTLFDSETGLTEQQIVNKTGFDHPIVSATLQYGQDQGWVDIEEQVREELIPAEEAEQIVSQGFPERRVLKFLAAKERIPLRNLAETAKQQKIPMNEVIKWGTMRGWVEKDKGDLVITEKGRKAQDTPSDDEKVLDMALRSGSVFLDELMQLKIDQEQVKKFLSGRPNAAKIKQRTIRSARINEHGRRILTEGVAVIKERNVLTSEDITSGDWKNIRLRRYDITLEAERIFPAKIHPVQKIIQETRRAFLEIGFTEIVSPMVESAFWDFDALFQPQDHPARDMQDTFYLTRPKTARLPDDDLVDRVRKTHENGWETGSTGWGYNWDKKRARQVVLRTHTTASTIRALAGNPKPPRKVFCVGKVFRNEAISFKHLPEFFQVDGMIIDEHASLATLLGTLKEFYRKMGFEKIKFKPSFYPYTEPSADVIVYMESKKKWIELGGSGVFRPEVTLPFGCSVPVLAWGLGLDRLAMIRYGINDIRELFWSDLDKIREVPLCR